MSPTENTHVNYLNIISQINMFVLQRSNLPLDDLETGLLSGVPSFCLKALNDDLLDATPSL